jgi:polyphosphate kinase
LEHARVFVFANGGTPLVYLASADGMTRNLERRVEIAWPVLDPDLREEVLHHLHLQLADNTKARILDAGQTNTYRTARSGEVKVQAQTDFYEWLRLQMN